MQPSTSHVISKAQLRRNAQALLTIRRVPDLAALLDCPYSTLEKAAYEPVYHYFTIPKTSGSGFREIEDPEDNLKLLQKDLNELLQSVYYFHRSEAAYGFLAAVQSDSAPRNIRTNAERHVGNPWMLNADFKDFFHSVTESMLRDLWTAPPFEFQDGSLVEFLTRLCTYQGRLPMGAPTSPILSNWAAKLLDADLLSVARSRQWTYTRFADDLTFSGRSPMTTHDVQEIRQLCRVHGFAFNEQKVHLFSPSATKTVTGLVVTDAVDVPDSFLEETTQLIEKFKVLREAQYRSGDSSSRLVSQARREIEGCLRFASFILSKKHPDYKILEKAFAHADAPINPHGSVSWLHFANYC